MISAMELKNVIADVKKERQENLAPLLF